MVLINEHILAIQPHERIITVWELNNFAIIGQGNMPASAASTERDSKKVTDNKLLKIGSDIGNVHIQSTVVRVAKELSLKH